MLNDLYGRNNDLIYSGGNIKIKNLSLLEDET